MGGKDTIVEIDEALMGKKHGPQKFGNNPNILKIWVFGMFGEEKSDIKRMRFWVVKNRKETLHPIIEENIDSRSVIFSDGWSAYNGLSEKFAIHRYCNHS